MSTDNTPAVPRLKSAGAKMEPELIARIDALKPLYPGADGADASRSSVMRGLVDLALAVHESGQMGEVERVAQQRGITVPEAVALLLETGLDNHDTER